MTDQKLADALSANTLALRELTQALNQRADAATRPEPSAKASTRPPDGFAPATSFSGDWRTFAIPFGKQAGKLLGALPESSLTWWAENYKAEGYQGRPPRDSDLAFRAALDAAVPSKGGAASEPEPVAEADEDFSF